jgi:glutamate carboxypeptidase
MRCFESSAALMRLAASFPLGSRNSIDYIRWFAKGETEGGTPALGKRQGITMDTLLTTLQSEQQSMLALLRRFVEMESPSTDKAAVDRLSNLVASVARDFGAAVRFYASKTTGNHLRMEFCFVPRPHGQILLLGHLDTVWELGTLAGMPFRIRNGRAYGPGVFDMKAGIVMGLYSLAALRKHGIPINKKIVMLLNADEEIGSPSSREFTEREARRSEAALVLEPAHGPNGALKTARKGTGEFEISVRGRAAHAGLEPEKGISAILELSRQLIASERLADYKRGITFNPGIIRGGTRGNVIPEHASATIDVRILRLADQALVMRKLRSLKPFHPEAKVEVTGSFNRPPLERSAPVAALFARAKRLATPLGIQLSEAAVGGGSDGNFTAALGTPTLDGLGAVGSGAHASDEHIIISECVRRTALLAHLIRDLSEG